MSHEYDNIKLISYYENNAKNISKSPKKSNNKTNGQSEVNKSPANKRGAYNFKRYTPQENGLTDVPVFITREQMGNFYKKGVSKQDKEKNVLWTLPNDNKNDEKKVKDPGNKKSN